MSYNGVGLTTPRGSGTNGYIQYSKAHLQSRNGPLRGSIEDTWTGQTDIRHRKPDESILEHERKRKIEVACLELEDRLEGQGATEDEIERQVSALREKLAKQQQSSPQRGRGDLKAHETHELAAMKAKENERMARAFGINTTDFKEGMAFDRDAQAQRIAQEKSEREARRVQKDEERQSKAAMYEAAAKRRQEAMRDAAALANRGDRGERYRRSPSLEDERMPPPPLRARRDRSPARGNGRFRSPSRSPPRRPSDRSTSPRRYMSRSRSPPPPRQRSRSPPLRRRFESRSPPPPPRRRRLSASPTSRSRDPVLRRHRDSPSPPRRRSPSPRPRRRPSDSRSPPPVKRRQRSASEGSSAMSLNSDQSG